MPKRKEDETPREPAKTPEDEHVGLKAPDAEDAGTAEAERASD